MTKGDWPAFRNVAREIRNALKRTCTCVIQDWSNAQPKGQLLFLETVHAQTLNFLEPYLAHNPVLYGTTEGRSRVDRRSLAIARRLKIVAVSNFVKRMLEDVKIPVAGVVHHGIDMGDKRFDRTFYRILKRKLKDRSVLLTISANHSRKGLGTLLAAYKEAEKQVKSTFLILHSEPTGHYNLPRIVKDLRIKNIWLTQIFGRMTKSKLNALYKLCAVYVQPSFSEGFGLPILEAFRFHKPVVAVDAPPFNEVIRNEETGILIPFKTIAWQNYLNLVDFKMHIYEPSSLSEAIVEGLSNTELLLAMRSRIARQKWRWHARRVYPELLNYLDLTGPARENV